MPGVNISLPCAAYTGDQPFAFVSYAHRDADVVYPEIRRFDLMGYRIWYDEGIDPGNEWPEEVASALKRCAWFVVFVTQRAIGSRNVRNEINYALRLEKPFFAIHLVETELPPGMELQMSSLQAILKWRMNEQTYVRNLERALPQTSGPAGSKGADAEGASGDELAELLARAMHNEYERQSGGNFTNWHQLDLRLKAQALKGSRSLLTMLHVAGFNVSRAEDTDEPVVFAADVLDMLARISHDLWCRERIEDGWRYGPARDRDKRLHPMLVSWDCVPASEREKDRQVVRQLPELLLKSGIAVSLMYERPERRTLFRLANADGQ